MLVNFNNTEKFMHVELPTALDLELIKNACLDLLDHEDFRAGMNVLWDGRPVTEVSLSYEEMQEFGAFLAPYRERRGSGRSAFLAPTDLLFGVFRIHEMLNRRNYNYYFRVFRDYERAHTWLLEEGVPGEDTLY